MAESKPAQIPDRPDEPTSIHELTTDEMPMRPSVFVWIALVFPLVLAVVILSVSPNFRSIEGVRGGPLAGDYLQEWIGGTIAGSDEKERLYDADYSESLQHDATLVGFEWASEKAYPIVYPPFYYQAQRLLAVFEYSTAMRIWTILSGLAISISAYLLYRYYPPCRRLLGISVLVALMYAPLLSSLNMGQKSAFLLLILSATFALLHQRRPFSAGVVFGLIAFKPYLGIVIGLTMLFKRQWNFALGAMLMVGVLVGAAVVERPQWWADYCGVVMNMGDYVVTAGYQPEESHSLWGAMQLTLEGLDSSLIKAVTIGLSLGIIVLLGRVMRGPIETGSDRFSFQFSAMVFATAILSPHFYTYDLTILLLPILLLSIGVTGKWRSDLVTRGLVCGLFGLFVFSGMFANIARFVGFQPSIGLMIAMIYLIGRSLDNRTKRSDQKDLNAGLGQ